ncbi:DUF4376 domain-containing protein [Labrenzia sp. R4_1]|uniref:DUF4376 domain-containing protein n=1 Tax=Labrenzia sp. R4_1 TaxID=2821106 RepID=UPI001AD99D3D|nr:DUF4376 domain-containing protein [Labrenzia sp. R4_1]MBO9424696.1 DUF4376 domain-containing protein [Labrenzia sp. R4_1]
MKAVIALSDGRCTHLFPDEAVVDLTAEKLESPVIAFGVSTATHEVVSVSEPPSEPYNAYGWVGGAWVVLNQAKVDAVLEASKAAKRFEVRELRKAAESSGITVAGLPVPTDDKTRDRVDQIVNAYADGDITGTVDFELPSGDFVELNAVQMQAIKAAGAQHIQACFSSQKTLVQAINAAPDHDALAAIDITAGWP